MTETPEQTHSKGYLPGQAGTTGLLLWMVGVMLLGWFLLDGPGISSIVKRVEPLRNTQQTLRHAFGEPEQTSSPYDRSIQP